jgi:hypothetical protein
MRDESLLSMVLSYGSILSHNFFKKWCVLFMVHKFYFIRSYLTSVMHNLLVQQPT